MWTSAASPLDPSVARIRADLTWRPSKPKLAVCDAELPAELCWASARAHHPPLHRQLRLLPPNPRPAASEMHAWPASRRAGTARVHQHADDDASGEELGPGRQASGAVPLMEAVGREELSTAQPGQREHVLEVGGRRCERSDHRGMGRAFDDAAELTRRSQQRDETIKSPAPARPFRCRPESGRPRAAGRAGVRRRRTPMRRRT